MIFLIFELRGCFPFLVIRAGVNHREAEVFKIKCMLWQFNRCFLFGEAAIRTGVMHREAKKNMHVCVY